MYCFNDLGLSCVFFFSYLGAPKLNRPELEVACEDFSNIIDTFDCSTIYKGTLSSGVEIAVASVSVTSSKDWSKSSEQTYRKKVFVSFPFLFSFALQFPL